MEDLNHLVKLHPEAKEISFKHKFVIQNVFKKSVLGNLGINYFSLMIIDSNQTLSIYSSCPALEYNMIHQNLWLYDGVFELKNHSDGSFIFWDELYSDSIKKTLISEKERKFGFQFGFFIMKRINNLFVIYSFATKSQNDRVVYKESKDILNNIGDYFFAALEAVHQAYLIDSSPQKKVTHSIRLIVDNTK